MHAVRIAMACHYFPPHIGGIEVVAEATAASAADRGHEVTVLTSRASGAGGRSSPHPHVRERRLPAWNVLEERVGIPYPLFGLRYGLAARRAVRAADIVHVHDVFYLSSHIVGALAVAARRPLVLTQHVGVVDHANPVVVAVQKAVYATVGRFLFRRAKHVVVYNAEVRETVRRYAPGASVLEMRNGIDLTRFQPCSDDEKRALRRRLGLPEDRPVVLFVGRLVTKKGWDLVHTARHARFLTVFVGSGDLPPGTTSDDDALFLGAVDRNELAELYQASDVFVFPSNGEPFTLGMQEAMASGLPVVTSDEPGYAEAGLDRRLVRLVPREVDAIRDAVLTLLDDDGLRAEAGAYSRSFAESNFSWESNVGRVLDLYEA